MAVLLRSRSYEPLTFNFDNFSKALRSFLLTPSLFREVNNRQESLLQHTRRNGLGEDPSFFCCSTKPALAIFLSRSSILLTDVSPSAHGVRFVISLSEDLPTSCDRLSLGTRYLPITVLRRWVIDTTFDQLDIIIVMKKELGRLVSMLVDRRCLKLTEKNAILFSRRCFSFSLQNQIPIAPYKSSKHPSFSSYKCTPWGTFQGQKRSMFIQTQSTPNPASLMFYPGKPVMEVGSADFPNARAAMPSPLAKALYGIDGITRVFFGTDFITITKSEEASWDFLKPEIFAAIMDFYSSGQPLFLDSNVAASMDTVIHEDDSEVVAMIKELLETRIRPAVQDDGGDIEYRGFDPETGIVKLRMQGACSGCPSSSVTLKSGIENMLMHYVSEVKGVEQELDDDDDDDAALSSQID